MIHDHAFSIATAAIAVAALGDAAFIAITAWQPAPLDDLATVSLVSTYPTANPFVHNEPPPLDTIVQWPLFGRFRVESPLPDVSPPTSLALQLRAVFVHIDPAATFAVIADPSGVAQAYALDAALPGGAVVHAIADDRVVLRREGQFETLYFHLPETDSSGASLRIIPPAPTASADPQSPISAESVAVPQRSPPATTGTRLSKGTG